jgi:tetratricopeptide (TPR) repeat protein
VFSGLVRVVVVAVCGFLTIQTIRIARADWLATHPPPAGTDKAGIDKALDLVPEDAALLLRAALAQSDSGDMSPAVDRRLLRAAAANPLNADIPMALGLREEFRGHPADAERYLKHAAELDHTFKPAWTLINFYARNGQPDKTWPLIARALALNPFGFNPAPIFDLCWSQGGDEKKITALMPTQGMVPVEYLIYLLTTKRTDAAIDFWPATLAAGAVNLASSEAQVLAQYPDFLIAANRIPEAVRGWNDLVAKKIIASGRLDRSAGMFIADPNFDFPLLNHSFAWRTGAETGLFVESNPSLLRFQFDGNEPESSFVLLTTLVPLLPGKAYRLVWKSDGSGLSAPRDPGFGFRITWEPGESTTECPPLLVAGDEGACAFTTLPGAGYARLELRYARALGTTRVQGSLGMISVRVEPVS